MLCRILYQTAVNSDFLWLFVPNIKETSHVGNPNNIFNSYLSMELTNGKEGKFLGTLKQS
jgi:hypothetical protein